ncbi:uncharacterized protein EI90DRAFT_3084885 [Cantharellus anzutake]|uniref:uncharacterized protein n=1 Tax=Cantharellus anzutake TaxID=1750568 RepID=UPI0019030AD6|nr:uncharacterized protein EI90DRAFT_3084885 [Cantharellus anzutake]KAF8317750.1 hypothetical protein EI90DRAFT_3084885 [Cantharellus anzutake]
MSDHSITQKHATGPQSSALAPPRIYNAIYSAVQVFECMVRGIAVMRRRVDSYVNATQILKVAGIDKGRRTKILEKEILPGKHEIVQGGYGKYQGTWIPLERGRELATQFGVAPLLAPLFDYVAPNASMPRLPVPNAIRSYQSSPPSTASHVGSHQASFPSTPQSAAKMSPSTYQSMRPPAPQTTDGHLQSPFPNSAPSTSSPVHPRPSAVFFKKKLREDLPKSTHPHRSLQDGADKLSDGKTLTPPTKRVLSPVDPTTRFATEPSPSHASRSSILGSRSRTILSHINNDQQPNMVLEQLTHQTDIELEGINMTIDDEGHTTLHWAANLSRISLMEALIDAGADIHRGNNMGETPLIRSILSSAAFASQSLPRVLELLSASIRTVDALSRSVLHHAALVAGVKNRASSARYYMETILEYVARNEGAEGLRSIVDLPDLHGDTALNLAARVGNRSLVRNLLDVGANPLLANKLGLRPGDFGVEHGSLDASKAGDMISALRTGPTLPVRRRKDLSNEVLSIIEGLDIEFNEEAETKRKQLDDIQNRLRTATRELASQRRLIQHWQAACSELDQILERIKNVKGARDSDQNLFHIKAGTASRSGSLDPPLLEDDYPVSLTTLRRKRFWHSHANQIISDRLSFMKGQNAEKELQCKKLVSLCTGVPLENVEPMLENLLVAMESDGTVPEIGRVSGFMQKIKSSNG